MSEPRFIVHRAAAGMMLALAVLALAAGTAVAGDEADGGALLKSLITEMAQAMQPLLEDTSSWHRLPAGITGISHGCGHKPMVRLVDNRPYNVHESVTIVQASAAWPVTFEFQNHTVGAADGRLLNTLSGYFDGKTWHPLENSLAYLTPDRVVWLSEGPAYGDSVRGGLWRLESGRWVRLPPDKPDYGTMQVGVWQFREGRWQMHDLSYGGMPATATRDVVQLQAGAGGTMTAWLSAGLQPPPPREVHLWDGRAWRVIRPADGLPDDPVLWAGCVAPSKLWVVTRPDTLTFIDLEKPFKAVKTRMPVEQVEDYLAAAEQDRPAMLDRMRLDRRPIIEAASALVVAGGTPPNSPAEFQAILAELRAAAAELQALLAQAGTPLGQIEACRLKVNTLTARVAALREPAVAAAKGRMRYDTLLGLIAALSSGGDAGGKPAEEATLYVMPVGLESDGHAWIKRLRRHVGEKGSDDETLLRLGPDGRREVVASGDGLYNTSCVMSPTAGPYLARPEGGLWRWNGKGLVQTIAAGQWQKDWTPVAATDDGWIYVDVTPKKRDRAAMAAGRNYLLVRPDAKPCDPLPPQETKER